MNSAQLLAIVIVAALAIGVVLRIRRGKVRSAKKTSGVPDEVRAVLDGKVTLVMFTTQYCANCKHARPVLQELSAATDGLGYAEVDLTDKASLAKELSVLSTPTTLAVEPDGTEIFRVTGVPKRDDLVHSLRPHLQIS